MLAKILLLVALATPADEAAAALALAKASRERADDSKSTLAGVEAEPARPQISPASATAAGYSAFYQEIAGGASGVLFVGRPLPSNAGKYGNNLAIDSLDGFGPGVYDCFRAADGRVMYEPRPEAVRAIPSFATPVRNLIYQFAPRSCAGGNCPR